MTSKSTQVSAADKTLIVLKATTENRRYSDIVAATGLAKATVHRLLRTLTEYEFVTLTPDGDYLPGPAALRLAGTAFGALDISTIAAPFVEKLAESTGYTVHVGALNWDEAIYVAKHNGTAPYHIPSNIGDRLLLHSTAIGKALLAGLTKGEVDQIAKNSGLTPRTPNTITNLNDLHAELEATHARGYSFDDEENVPGIRCIGAPIFNHSGKVSYGISMTSLALENSLEQVEKYAPAVTEAAAEISRALGSQRSKYA